MDLTTARTELRARGFDYLTDGRCNTFLNTAKTEIEDSWPWPWLEVTTTGTAPLTITDLKDVLYVVDTTSQRELVSLEFRDRILGDPALTVTGTPEYWSLDGLTTIVLWPVSTTASLSVRYIKTSPVLTETTDTPLFPVQYHGTWIDRAVVEALRDSDNQGEANVLLAEVTRRIQQMVVVLGGRNPVHQRIDFANSLDW